MAAVRYSKILSRVGTSIGTIVAVPKPDTWSDTSGNNMTTEGNKWTIGADYPGWFECAGQNLSKTDYAMLYDVIGGTYGETSTTFKLPDYRGKFLFGTGEIDGNRAGSGSMSANAGPTGGSGGGPETAGSTGGEYKTTTLRVLPATSEITPEQVKGPEVFYSVDDSFLTSKASYNGTALIDYGEGSDKRPTGNAISYDPGPYPGMYEMGGFVQPFQEGVGNKYVGFGTFGTSPFNSLRTTREVTYTLDLTNYDEIIVLCQSGNDNNGGERINNNNEGLYLRWPNGNETAIIPAKPDSGIDDLAEWDAAYSYWKTYYIQIPTAYKTSNVAVRFKQGAVSNWEYNNTASAYLERDENTDPNANDHIGLAMLGFRGADIEPLNGAEDTFTVQAFRTAGWEGVTGIVQPQISGFVRWNAGPTESFPIPIAPGHSHEIRYAYANDTVAVAVEYPGQASSAGNAFADVTLDTLNLSGNAPDAVPRWNQSLTGKLESFNRQRNLNSQGLKEHSHKLEWATSSDYATFGQDNSYGQTLNPGTSGNAADVVYNIAAPSPATLSVAYNRENDNNMIETAYGDTTYYNIGANIQKYASIDEEMGVFYNIGQVSVSSGATRDFDDSLTVRLQGAEEFPNMQPYFRMKYIIKAY